MSKSILVSDPQRQVLDQLEGESQAQAAEWPEKVSQFPEESNPVTLSALIDTSLQCPKCGQIMGFRVEEGTEAVAVCDRCRIPMRAMPKVVRTQRDEALLQRVHNLERRFLAMEPALLSVERHLAALPARLQALEEKKEEAPASHKRSFFRFLRGKSEEER